MEIDAKIISKSLNIEIFDFLLFWAYSLEFWLSLYIFELFDSTFLLGFILARPEPPRIFLPLILQEILVCGPVFAIPTSMNLPGRRPVRRLEFLAK